jgi:hypothetical protein
VVTSGSGSPAEPVTAAVDPSVDPDVIDPDAGHIQGDECTDAFFRDFGQQEHDTHKWYMNASTMPGYFGVDNATVIARIREEPISASNAWAVGQAASFSNPNPRPVALRWNGTSWQ